MPWAIDYSPRDRIVTAKCEGPFTSDDLDHMTRASVARMREERALRVLLDFSIVDTRFSIADICELPNTYTELRAPRLTHIAIVVPADGYRVDTFKFYEDFAVNRGYFARLFSKQDDAKTWLLDFDDR